MVVSRLSNVTQLNGCRPDIKGHGALCTVYWQSRVPATACQLCSALTVMLLHNKHASSHSAAALQVPLHPAKTVVSSAAVCRQTSQPSLDAHLTPLVSTGMPTAASAFRRAKLSNSWKSGKEESIPGVLLPCKISPHQYILSPLQNEKPQILPNFEFWGFCAHPLNRSGPNLACKSGYGALFHAKL